MKKTLPVFVSLAALTVALSGLAPSITSSLTSSITSSLAQSPSKYPMAITSCGQKFTLQKMPERVITTYSVTTEIMLRLGLEGKIVGAANFGEAMPADLQTAYQKLNLYGADYKLPREVTLSLKPDFVFDNEPVYTYDAASGNATQTELRTAGAQIFSLTAKCGGGRKDTKLEDTYNDLRTIGRIFAVEARAQALIREMSSKIAGVRARVAGKKPLKAMIYDSGTGPLTVYGTGTWDTVLRLAGGANAFANLPEAYANLSVEEVASREIDVFVIFNDDGNGQARADYLLKTFPNSNAAKNKRVAFVPYAEVNPGVRNHLGVETLAKAMYPDVFKK